MGDVWTAVGRVVGEALSLAFPVECAGCGALDVPLCDGCRGLLRPRAVLRRRVPAPGGGVDVWSGLVFDSVPARAVRALKEEGRTGLARALAPALAAAVDAALATAGAGLEAGCDDPAVAVAPVPASRAAMRRRGFRVVELVARRAGLRPVRILRLTRAAADQRRLGREERAANAAGTMAASAWWGRRVIVVDDVLTTGATLSEATRALRAAGAEVIGAATIAATPRRSASRSDASGTHA